MKGGIIRNINAWDNFMMIQQNPYFIIEDSIISNISHSDQYASTIISSPVSIWNSSFENFTKIMFYFKDINEKVNNISSSKFSNGVKAFILEDSYF